MSRNDAGFVRALLDDITQDIPLRLHIQRRSSLIQQKDRSITQNRPGDGNTLRLPLRQTTATLTHHRIDALRQFLHKTPCTRHLKRLNAFPCAASSLTTLLSLVKFYYYLDKLGLLEKCFQLSVILFLLFVGWLVCC